MRLALAHIALLLPCFLQAQLVINEACSKNNHTVATTQGLYNDWIEIHNAGSSNEFLANYFLSDDDSNLQQWRMPNLFLGPGQFVIFFSGDGIPNPNHFNFNLSQDGDTIYLSDLSGYALQRLDMPFLESDHSIGSYLESGTSNYLFALPTPGFTNNSTAYKAYADEPKFYPEARLVEASLDVIIQGAAGQELRYTTDGRIPDLSSYIVNGPIATPVGTAYQARAFGDSLLPSPIAGSAYLFKPRTEMPVISLQVDPDSMFDPILGMHMLGLNADTNYPFFGANYWAERELPVQFTYFESNGLKVLDQTAGLQIHGGRASRSNGQKPFRITARGLYGDKDFDQPFFPEQRDVDSYKRIILRNSGSDWCLSNFRDGFWHRHALRNELDVDVLAFRPSVVYMNGAYWGLMNMRERIDDEHLANLYRLNEDSLLIMEGENESIQGDSALFEQLDTFIANEDLNDPSNWAVVSAQLDISSITDYFILELFAGNPDWPSNNVKYWKAKADSGLWRYYFFDLDASMDAFGWFPGNTDTFDYLFNIKAGFKHTELFRNLFENDEFQRNFINRYADLLNTAFTPGNLRQTRNEIIDQFGGERQSHFDRWCWFDGNWDLHADQLVPNFINIRQEVVRDDIQSWYGLAQQHSLRFEVFPPGSGTIQLNSLSVDSILEGIYFEGNPIDLAAIPNAHAMFDRWEFSKNGAQSNSSMQWDPNSAQTIVAYFKTETEELLLYPNPSNDRLTIQFPAQSADEVEIRVMDVSGKVLRKFTRNVQAGVNGVSINIESLAEGIYFVSYGDSKALRAGRFLKQKP